MIWWYLSVGAFEFAVLCTIDRHLGGTAMSLVIAILFVMLGYLHKIYKHLSMTTPNDKERE